MRRTWKPGVSRVDDEAGHPTASLGGVGAGEDNAEVGDVGPGDEDLRAVDHPLVAVPLGLGADRPGRIRAAGGLGQSKEAALLAAQHRKQIALFLVVVGLVELGQPRPAEGSEAGRVEAGAMLRGLHGDQGLGDDVDLRPPELRWDPQAVEPHRPGHRCQPRLVLRLQTRGVGVELGLQRNHLFTDEPAHLFDDQGLLLGHLEVHGDLPQPGLRRPSRRRPSAALPGGKSPKSALWTISSSS